MKFLPNKNAVLFHIRKYLVFYVIICIIIFLRTYKVADFFSFNFDEEYQASLAWEQVKNWHPIWIGVSASNINYYLGPGFVYLNALLFALSSGDPAILAWFSTILGIATTISIYYVVSKIFNKRIGFIAMTLYGGSAFLMLFDRRFWNPSPIPFITIWMIYSLIQGKKHPQWYIVSIALYAVSLHVHLSLVLFLPLILASILIDRKKIRLLHWLFGFIVYTVITIPLLIFDLVHNFDNLLAPIRYVFTPETGVFGSSIAYIQRHLIVMFSALGKLWFLRFQTNIQDEHCLSSHCNIVQGKWYLILLSILLIVTFIYFAWKRRTRTNLILTFGILIYFCIYIFYSGYAAEYFLLSMYVMCCIVFAFILSKLLNGILVPFLTIFLIANAGVIFTMNQDQYGLSNRKKLVKQITDILHNQPFSLETYGTDPRYYHPYGGWRFLFKIYGHNTPVKSMADDSFGWIYPDELNQEQPKMKVVVMDTIKYKSKDKPVFVVKEGVYYGYIYRISD